LALRGALEHPKLLALADALGIMDCFALGVMEAFWHHIGKYHQDGDVTDLNPRVMARSIRYTGNGDELWTCLISAGFIDRTSGGRLIVHGWSEHADDQTNARLFRAVQPFADGTKPKPRSIGKEEKERLEALWIEREKGSDISRTYGGRLPDVLPEPEPEPEPEPKPEKDADARGTKPADVPETPMQRLASLCWSNFQSVQSFANGLTEAQKEGIAKVCAEYGHLEPARLLEESEKCADWYRAKPRYGGKGVTESTPAGNAFRSWLAKLKPEQTRTKPERDELLPISEVEVIGKCPD